MGAFEWQPVEVPAIDLVVDSLIDEMDGDYSAGDLSFREAIYIANFRPGPDAITFDRSLDGGTVALTRSQLGIFDELAVDATALADGLIIDALGNGRIFDIDDGNDQINSAVMITGLTFTGGHAPIGGAIRSEEILIVDSSTISGNSASLYGGGIWSSDAVTVNSSTISGNSATSWEGGGIWSSGTATVTSSTISGNSAEDGGGIHAAGELAVTTSTLSGNNSSRGYGGGIDAKGAVTVIKNSIVAGNTADWAADIRPGSSSLTVRYSLIGDNTGTGLVEAPVGTPDADGNLIGSPRGMGIIHPMVAPLGNRGGPTETQALLAGSPAIDAGDPDFAPPPDFDQRGNPRVADGNADGVGRIDMGAFEVLRGDLNGDGEVNGLDVDPFVHVLLNGPSSATADMNADGSVNGLDVDPFVAEVVGGTVSLGALNTELAMNTLDVGSTARQLHRRRPIHDSNHGDDPAHVIHRTTVQHTPARRSRMGTHVREDGQRSPPGDMVQDVQPETVDSWHGLVDRAMRDDTNWDRLR